MKKTDQTHYFSPGPASLPKEVINEIHSELVDSFHIGVSILEISHRSHEYTSLSGETLSLCKEVLQVPDTHSVLLSASGAQQHFALIPLQLSLPGETIAYARTGHWSAIACSEAQKYDDRDFHFIYDGYPDFRSLGDFENWKIPQNAKYVHLTVNNTVYGIEFDKIPTYNDFPLVLDMTSSLGARTDIPWEQTALIYASTQKNLGIAGVSVVIVRNDILEQIRTISAHNKVGKAFCYAEIFDAKSILNTPPVFSIFCLNKMLKWIKKSGGVKKMESLAFEKAQSIYSAIDKNKDFYLPYTDTKYRSRHNIIFHLKSKQESHFIKQALKENIREIKGYHTTGGIRVSIYNGVSLNSAKIFANFMEHYVSEFV